MDLFIESSLKARLVALTAELGSLESAEHLGLAGRLESRVKELAGWVEFERQLLSLWRTNDHAIVRGLGEADPITFILVALGAGRRFKSYRGAKIVKSFTMSPWTRALSHTLDEGHFHTDLNTSPMPPRVTAIQCVHPDPSGPPAGQLRVARVSELLAALKQDGHHRAVRFLTQDEAAMVSDTDPDCWRGRMIENGEIRFHPETLRAAVRRLAEGPSDLEEILESIKATAMQVSFPIHLDRGDILLVSNRRALHYRGACTVRFRTFPRDFDSRSVRVLHVMEESS